MWGFLGALACAAPAQEPTPLAPEPVPAVAAPAPVPAATPEERWPSDAGRYPWRDASAAYEPLWARVPPPAGYTRAELPDWPAWVRALPLQPAGSPVRTWRGGTFLSGGDPRLLAVVDLDVGEADLQQCADTVLRLRLEYLWQRQQEGAQTDIAFRYTSGDLSRWASWAAGDRPRVSGREVSWSRRAAPDASRASFEAWTRDLFTYAGSHSLAREGAAVPVADIMPGDFLSLGGSPGHAVVVLDVARDAAGAPVVLIGEGFMPAMSLHALAGPLDGWWPTTEPLQIPTWPEPFPWERLRRF